MILRKCLSRLPFTFHPEFFTLDEQRVLLKAALHRLDAMESSKHRRKRRTLLRSSPPMLLAPTSSNPLQDMFSSDALYEFQEGHFDGVIKNYREMHLSSWPVPEFPELSPIIERLHSVLPSQDTQTHLLHLASDGEIHPHVDNLEASGKWICGVSLGAERLLRLENDEGDEHSLLLPSGSVYIQRDDLRFNYKHSILVGGKYEGRELAGGQRVSIMIRDRRHI
ncbi:2OG-FeII-Oxy-2 domain-containing protein [Mycena kentingensis (nom. inval.)]|nr:2OG-FeII-Oxy-2 domain-containing protein [Mycena kentingensis (nom. inval.)]